MDVNELYYRWHYALSSEIDEIDIPAEKRSIEHLRVGLEKIRREIDMIEATMHMMGVRDTRPEA